MATHVMNGTTTVYTYVYLFSCAHHALERAQNEEQGRLYSCMTAMVFSMMTVEAYLNHVGQERVENWRYLERCSPLDKLEIVTAALRHPFDKSRNEYATLKKMKGFRDTMAHGKTEEVSGAIFRVDDGLGYEFPKAAWQQAADLKTATAWVELTEQIVREIHKSSGLPEKDPFGTAERSSNF